MKVYLVGGAVRDELLSIEVLEKDWVVVGSTEEDLTEEEIRMLCEEGRKVLLQQPMLIEMEGWFNGLSILLYSVLPRHQYILFCLFYLCMHFLFYRLFLCVHLF